MQQAKQTRSEARTLDRQPEVVSQSVLDDTIEALAEDGDDALAKAAAEGFPDPKGVVE